MVLNKYDAKKRVTALINNPSFLLLKNSTSV